MGFFMNKYKSENERILCRFFEQMHEDCDCNSSRIVWEWLRNAPCFTMFQLDKIGLWYENNEVVAVVRLNSPWPGCVVIDSRSTSKDLLIDVIHYAEETFSGMENNKKYLVICVNETVNNLNQELLNENYELLSSGDNLLQFTLSKEIPQSTLPEGFEVKTLFEVYDFDKLSKLIWEGFNYEGKVPKIDDEIYPPIKHAWLNYNRDICSVIIAPDGSYASFCGFWYDSNTQTGFLEPMVTANEYRKLGLGKACIYNSLRILQSYSCKKVFVGPDEEPYNYYCKIGFEKQNYMYVFKKVLE